MDNIMQRYEILVLPLPPFLRSLATEFLVGSEEEATENLRHRLEVIAIEQSAVSVNNKPEEARDRRGKSCNIAILFEEYISPSKVFLPKAPLPTYDSEQRASDYALWRKTRGHRITSPSFDEPQDAYERQEHLHKVVNLTTGANSAISRGGAVHIHGLTLWHGEHTGA